MHKFENIRKEFPILGNEIYLDNAATTQKPNCVIDAVSHYNRTMHANPHRGAYKWSILATDAMEKVRKQVASFIHANRSEEIIFTRGTTESINLVARCLQERGFQPGDEIVLTSAEHHSNLVPWQWVSKKTGAILKFIEVGKDGSLSLEDAKKIITAKTKLVSIIHVSNVLGSIFPVEEIARFAHDKGALVLIDGAQSVPHMKVDVQAIGADFYVFSGHKLYAPTGIGVLYGKYDVLEKLPPFLYGGNMIEYVERETSTFAPIPQRFEAGTMPIEAIVGLGAAMSFLEELDLNEIHAYENTLTEYALNALKANPYVQILGDTEMKNRSSVVSFMIKDVHPHDVATILDHEGIAIRSGHHCAQPLLKGFGVPASCRVSFAFYNTFEEIELFISKLKTVRKWLGHES